MFPDFASTFLLVPFQRGLIFEFHGTKAASVWFSGRVRNAVLFQFVFCLEPGIALGTFVPFMPCNEIQM